MKKEKITKELFWVIGYHKKGYKIYTKQPRTKFVPEPFQTRDAAQHYIVFQISINA